MAERETGVADGAADHEYFYDHRCVQIIDGRVCGLGEHEHRRRARRAADPHPLTDRIAEGLRDAMAMTADQNDTFAGRAADPLANLRARHGNCRAYRGEGNCCDVGIVLAALDAEPAENEQIIEDLGRDVDAAVVANEQLRERAERAEAAGLTTVEWGVMARSYPDVPHKTGDEQWCRQWVAESEQLDASPGTFYVARRTVSRWEPA